MRKSILEKLIQASKGGQHEEINPGKNHSSIKRRAPGKNQSWKKSFKYQREGTGRKSILEKSFKYQNEGTGKKSILEKLIPVSKGRHREKINLGKNL